MSARDIINELPKLTEAERQAVLRKLLALAEKDKKADVDLRARGISQAQAADLRSRLKTFAEDRERPEATIYDENPPR